MAELSTSSPKSQLNQLGDPSPALNTVQTTLDKFLTAANVEAVYGPTVSQGENLVIPAAEVLSVVGFGLGLGGGSQSSTDTEITGGGVGGGGGGGRVLARPVAAIIMSPTGVRVEPIVDVTKIVLAIFTTLGFMAAMFTRMTKPGQRLKLND
jgi:uncharacterized spore protein YtfJ